MNELYFVSQHKRSSGFFCRYFFCDKCIAILLYLENCCLTSIVGRFTKPCQTDQTLFICALRQTGRPHTAHCKQLDQAQKLKPCSECQSSAHNNQTTRMNRDQPWKYIYCSGISKRSQIYFVSHRHRALLDQSLRPSKI
jgi:hypothetical protein